MFGFTDKSAPNLEIKVCGMRAPENIADLIRLKPDYLGFIFFDKSPRFVGNDFEEDTLAQIPETIKKVGVFVNESLEVIKDTAQKYKLEAVQLHGQESPIICRQLKNEGILVIKAFPVDDNFDFNEVAPYENTCDYYLFDTKGKDHGGNGNTFNWQILERYPFATPFFLSGGLDGEHAEQIKKLDLPALRGVDINSRFETSPGVKDAAQVKSFFQIIRK